MKGFFSNSSLAKDKKLLKVCSWLQVKTLDRQFFKPNIIQYKVYIPSLGLNKDGFISKMDCDYSNNKNKLHRVQKEEELRT